MILIVKTWNESTEEAIAYLKHNGYGDAARIPNTDLYLCAGDNFNYVELNDVEIILAKELKIGLR